MKINYKETTNDLTKRIDIHQKYGTKNIDQWMLSLLNPKKGIKILDVGCGHGKQCFLFDDTLKGDCQITGGDVSEELLAKAKEENKKRGSQIKFLNLDFNQKFPFEDNCFDLLTCCFAIYYARDIDFTVKEMFRVLKNGGRLFVTGPMPQNKKVFYKIIKKATKTMIPLMPGSSRYSTEIWSAINNLFPQTKLHIFRNPIIFNSVDPFMEYTRASLSEDRKIWANLFLKDDFEEVMEKIAHEAGNYLKRYGKIIMTKVVGGIIAQKRAK